MPASLLGVRATLWLGPTIAAPAPLKIVEALTSVEVTLNSEGRDAFQLAFSLGRGLTDMLDYPLVAHPLLRPFSRVIIQVWSGIVPQVLIDGFITRRDVTPSNEPGASTLTVTGEDIRIMMDLHETALPYPQMTAEAKVAFILLKYMFLLGLPPVIVPTKSPDLPILFERIPAYAGTDLSHIEDLAKDVDHVFYIEPTPVPMVNLAYWGPENRLSIPQSALSINMGPETNVTSLRFSYDALQATTVQGAVQEKRAGLILPIITLTSLRPPLAPLPAMLTQQPNVRSVLMQEGGDLEPIQALARAQALTDRSSDAVTAQGELDVLRYGGILRPRRLVGVRGAGFLHDGFYFVKNVTHRIQKGQYTQSFSLAREGLGALTPVVVP